jgi:hypothetical protein
MTSMRSMVMALAVVMVLANGGLTPAQGQVFWGEFGSAQTDFGNGTARDDMAWGAGFIATIGGDSGQKFGFAMPLNFEFRGNTKFDAMDLLTSGDLAFRIGPVSFGPGGNFGYIFRPKMADARCLSASAGAGCYAEEWSGYRDIGQFYGIGFSGFAKGTFGPQGRAYIQGRYIYYHPEWMFFRSAAQASNEQFGTELEVPTDFPDFKLGRDIRVSGGYVFGGAGGAAKILRAQLTRKEFSFTPIKANTNGIFNQKTLQLTFGVGFAF